MTKEEVLEMAHPDKSYLTPPSVNYETAYKAMDIFAKQEAIAFTNWVLKQGWNLFGDADGRFWRLYSESKTTEQLYQLFLNQSKQQ